MLETDYFALKLACLVLSGAAAWMPTLVLAQAGPPADTAIPAQFQDSYKVYLEMKTKAVPPKHVPDWSGLWTRKDDTLAIAGSAIFTGLIEDGHPTSCPISAEELANHVDTYGATISIDPFTPHLGTEGGVGLKLHKHERILAI